MNTSSQPGNPSILVKIADRLMAAQRELDELAVQLSLGKADAKEKFDEIRKEFQERLNELKQRLTSAPKSDDLTTLALKIEELSILLSSSAAKTQNTFDELKAKIIQAITEIETRIKSKFLSPDELNHLTIDFEKLKLKLEILRLMFVVKKFEVKEGFRAGMKTAGNEIAKIVDGTGHQMKKARGHIEDYTHEISQAYQHLHKAIKNIG